MRRSKERTRKDGRRKTNDKKEEKLKTETK